MGCCSPIFELADLSNSSLPVVLYKLQDVFKKKKKINVVLSKLNHPKITALALLFLAQTAHGSHQGSSNQRQKQFVCLNPTATDTCRVQPWTVYSALFMLLFVEILDIEVGAAQDRLRKPNFVVCSWWGLLNGVGTQVIRDESCCELRFAWNNSYSRDEWGVCWSVSEPSDLFWNI